jgi:hypothetical protein
MRRLGIEPRTYWLSKAAAPPWNSDDAAIRGAAIAHPFFGMILGIGFLLLVSLVGVGRAERGGPLAGRSPGSWDVVVNIVNSILSFDSRRRVRDDLQVHAARERTPRRDMGNLPRTANAARGQEL